MPTFPLVSPSTIEVVIQGEVTGTNGEARPNNVFHYSSYGLGIDVDDSVLLQFLAALSTAISVQWRTCFPEAYVVGTVSARWMEDSTTAVALDPTPGNYTGIATGDYQPPDSSWFIQKRTAFRGKPGRGGFKLSPIRELDTSGFSLENGFLTTQATALRNALATNVTFVVGGFTYSLRPWLLSQKYSTIVPSGPCVIRGAPVTSLRVRKTLGSQLSRKVKGVY